MKQVPLGSQGLVVSQQGLGCMGMSEWYGEADESESVATLQRAVELGITFFDTADVYGPFTNEVLVGRTLRPYRDSVVIATKFGNRRGPNGERLGISGKPEYVREACDASLQRLGLDEPPAADGRFEIDGPHQHVDDARSANDAVDVFWHIQRGCFSFVIVSFARHPERSEGSSVTRG